MPTVFVSIPYHPDFFDVYTAIKDAGTEAGKQTSIKFDVGTSFDYGSSSGLVIRSIYESLKSSM